MINARYRPVMTKDQVIKRLRAECVKAGGQNAWGLANGVERGLLSRIMAGKKPPSSVVLRPLGLVRTVSYDPVEDKS